MQIITYAIIGVIVAAIGVSIAYYQNTNIEKPVVNFSDIKITKLTSTSATIEGITDKAVRCEIEYGKEDLDSTATDNMGKMNMPHEDHKVTIMGLEPNTTYKYRFKVQYDGEIFYSDIRTFTT